MTSLVPQRFKAAWNIIVTGRLPYKNLYSSGFGSFYNIYGQESSRNIASTEFGAAQAYGVITGVQRGIAFWEKQVGGLEWNIYDSKDQILASSSDRSPPSGPGAMLYRAIKRFPHMAKHGFFESIAFSDWLYGETYMIWMNNAIQASDLFWANPLAIEPYIDPISGLIEYYTYDNSQRLAPKQVAFRIAHRNPFEDLRGQSPILSAIDEINISRNVKRALIGYYRSGMTLGGIISPGDDKDLTGEGLTKLEQELERNHKGVAHFHRWLVSNGSAKVDQFEQPDMEKNLAIIEPMRNEIMMALGVPPVLAGDPTQVNYDNADKVMVNWWKSEGKPYARGIAEDYINGQIVPVLEPNNGVYFGFDFSSVEIEEPETINADISGGYITIATAQERRGVKVDEDLRDIYIIAGRPMHKDIIVELASQNPQPQLQEVAMQLEPAPLRHLHIEGHTLEVETWEYTREKALKELVNWQRKARIGKAFEPFYTRGDISDLIISCLNFGGDIVKTFDMAFSILKRDVIGELETAFNAFTTALLRDDVEAVMKSLQSIRLDFEIDFEDVLKEIRSGNIDNRRRAGNILRQIIRTFGFRAYVQGMKDGGVEDDPDEEDQAKITELRQEQTSYVSNLTSVLIQADGITDTLAAGKPEMWFRKSIMPFYYAGLESAQKNMMMEFAGDDGEESCGTCKRLKGQRHRLKDWTRKALRPQIDTHNFICGGWKCEHKLIPTTGKAQGKF